MLFRSVGIGTSNTVGYTNNVLAVFGVSSYRGNVYISNTSSISGIFFSDGSFQNTANTRNIQAVISATTADGATTAFSSSPYTSTNAYMQVYVDGIYQPASTYTWSGTTVTLNSPPPNATIVELVISAAANSLITNPNNITIGSTVIQIGRAHV